MDSCLRSRTADFDRGCVDEFGDVGCVCEFDNVFFLFFLSFIYFLVIISEILHLFFFIYFVGRVEPGVCVCV